MSEKLYGIQAADYTDSPWPHYQIMIIEVKPEYYHCGKFSKVCMLQSIMLSFKYGFVCNMLSVLKFVSDFIPVSPDMVVDALSANGKFEYILPLSDIYYEE